MLLQRKESQFRNRIELGGRFPPVGTPRTAQTNVRVATNMLV